MVSKKILVIFISIMLIFSTGCWDKVEIDERAFVLAIAVDTAKKSQDVSDSRIKVIYYMPIPSKLQSGAVDAFSVEESVGENMPMTLENLNMKFSRNIFLAETKILLIGESALKNEKILNQLMDYFEKEPDVGRDIKIGVVKGDTAALASIKPKFEKVFEGYMKGIFDNAGNKSSILSLPINEFLSSLRENKGSTIIPVGEVEGDKVAVKQLALIKDYKLLSYMDTKYLRPYSIITKTLKDGYISLPYKKANVEFKVTSCDRKIFLQSHKDKFEYKINVVIEGDIHNYYFNENIFDSKIIDEIKDKIKKKVKNELDKTTEYFQNDVGYDYLKIGEYTKKYHNKLYKPYKENWDEEFKKAKINYDVQVFIRRVGESRE